MTEEQIRKSIRDDIRKNAEEIRRKHSIYNGGEQVITIADSYFTHEGAEGKLASTAGTEYIVNHDNHPDTVWVITRNGKCSTERRDNLRRMTPDDEGYMATKEQWWKYFRRENRDLHRRLDAWRCVSITAISMLIWIGIIYV